MSSRVALFDEPRVDPFTGSTHFEQARAAIVNLTLVSDVTLGLLGGSLIEWFVGDCVGVMGGWLVGSLG